MKIPHTHKYVSGGFVISLEYMLVATLLGITVVVALMGVVRSEMMTQLMLMDSAVVSLNDDSTEPITLTRTATAPIAEGDSGIGEAD